MASGNSDGILYRCHDGDHLSGWWCQNRFNNLSTQKPCTFMYAKRSKVDIINLGGEYLAYIGGQNHILCFIHGLPLINSIEKILMFFW